MTGDVPDTAITAANLPQEWLDVLDKRAGKEHSREGSVVACLTEILNLATAAEREACARHIDSLEPYEHNAYYADQVRNRPAP